MKIKIKIHKRIFNTRYYELLTKQLKDITILYGGAASGKSYAIAQYYLIQLLKGNRNLLVIRKVGNTLRDSVYALFISIINNMGLNQEFEVNKTEMRITCKNGYQIIMKGLDDPEKIKSITVNKGNLTDCWIEEATELTETDFNQLQLRLRGGKVSKKYMLTFNPISNLHWIKRRFFDKKNENVEIIKTTYKDNSFLTVDDIKRIEDLKTVDYQYYRIYALGEWGVIGNLVYTNWEVKEIERSFDNYYFGVDFGWNDPAVCLKCAIREKTIYILDEIYVTETPNKDFAEMIKKIANREPLFCDSAEPKSINELRSCGINAISVKKGADSIEYGIRWLKGYKIVVDSKCTNTISELQSYKYREDKTGQVISENPLDKNNHAMDALRYAFNDIMNLKTEIRINKRLPGI